MDDIKKAKFTKFVNVMLFAVSAGIMLYFCIHNNNLITLINWIPNLDVFGLISAFFCIISYWFIDAKIIHVISKSVYRGDLEFRKAFKVTMIGQFFNSVTPFAVAGQPMQLLTMVKRGVPSGTAVSILVQKFLIYHISLTVYSVCVIAFRYAYFKEHFKELMLLTIVGFLAQSSIVVLLLVFSLNRKATVGLIKFIFKILAKLRLIKDPQESGIKLENQLEFYLKNNKKINRNFKLTVRLYLLTISQLTVFYIISFFIYKSFHGAGFPVIDMISAQSFVSMMSYVNPLPGGIGAAETSFLLLFNLFFEPGVTNQAMLLWRFITYYSSIIVGVFFARSLIGTRKREAESYDYKSRNFFEA